MIDDEARVGMAVDQLGTLVEFAPAQEVDRQVVLDRRLEDPVEAGIEQGPAFARPIEGSELLGMATGESLAHLNHLVARGEALREPGVDGALRYRLR